MTLEESIEWVCNTFNDNFPLSDGDKAESIEALINRVYRDFESRTCDTCKYNLNGIECNCNESAVEWIDTDTFPYFGCNEFERKQND